jgi:cytochrome P450
MNQEQHMQQTPLAGARRLPPGPRGYPVVGSTLAVQRDAIGFVRAVTGRYGDIVSYRFLGRPSVILNHPDYAKHMLQEHNHNYDKEVFTYRMITWFLGDGLLTTSGDAWLRQRRLMQPAFHRKRVAGWSTLMGGVAGRFLDRWERLDTPMIDVADEMILLTLSVVSRALFSLDISDAAGPVGHTFLAINRHYVNYAATLLAPPRVPMPRNRRFKAAVRRLDEFAYGVIRERRAGSVEHDDLLTVLLESRDEETGAMLDDGQVRDEIMTLLFAGHETAANALTWTWYLIAMHASVEEQLHAEVDRVLGGRLPVAEDLPNLPYTRMVIDEALRLYPPVWIIPRRAIADDEIGGYRVPKDTVVNVVPYVLHRHPLFWERPEAFDPERWMSARSRPAAACLHSLRRRPTALYRQRLRAHRDAACRRHPRAAVPAASRRRPARGSASGGHAGRARWASYAARTAVGSYLLRLPCLARLLPGQRTGIGTRMPPRRQRDHGVRGRGCITPSTVRSTRSLKKQSRPLILGHSGIGSA